MSVLSPYLTDHNTFRIRAKARGVYPLESIDGLIDFLKGHRNEPYLVLGQGSNVLFTEDYPHDVALVRWLGKRIEPYSETEALLIAAAGEPWHELVMWSLHQQLGGLENLALIPGSTGAAPLQNIGAYGVEVKDVFEWCKAIHRNTLEERIFTFDQCDFGYRESVFKKDLKDQYIITEVALRLSKKNHQLNTSYAPLKAWFEERNNQTPITPLDIAEAVCHIRSSKLPDPKVLGNAGSFFKNPVISAAQAQLLRTQNESTPLYPQADGRFKVAAGWLIEKLQLKGFSMGQAGVHDKQALVLINKGEASGREIFELSAYIKQQVTQTYGIELEEEVTIF